MKELIDKTDYPRSRETIKQDLVQLGVHSGMTILVHSSLSSIGWVNGGAVSVVQALMDLVTEEGTIIMPSQSTDLSDPSEWQFPAVPKEWWNDIKETMPAYDPEYTPTTGMGKVVEVFRAFPGVIRSMHPAYSFVAWGKNKEKLLNSHEIDFGLGELSPLGKLYKENTFVLMIGVGYDSNTCFHLAEYRDKHKTYIKKGAPVIEYGQRVWKVYDEIQFNEEKFEEIGKGFEKSCHIEQGKIGSANSKLFSMREAVDWAENWLNK
ncbi:aminoglycoside N(3)-acetyltransferase [Halalkalibacter akibai]|uniref:Aminoglycoside N(3)-acetyltransferase n=1 Tax=Halalkalibacter akibai (strain ATCC 43226 / DSM 21942 / CIP 109018 / JCM 9157 / 1139) TaxID=1236973 RepID=W4QZM1_HALA3|nr:AAC(3) family N-acetyltransferase [Halalkalibacter akibai]GAE37516.1 aminoglycoside N3-acetyltransferase [Halalkalibacter akibai JCM 9157]